MLPSIFDDMFLRETDEEMKCDIYEKENMMFVEMDLPGFERKDINIEFSKGNLTVTASKKQEEKENKKYYRRERSFYGKFSRTFFVGDIEEEKIAASFKEGTLTIQVPKEEKRGNKKLIEIK